MDTTEIDNRHAAAVSVATTAASLAMRQFREYEVLNVERKGIQDFVSDADRAVEASIREALGSGFPEDGIIGEEEGSISGKSGYTWVIDPIDGTSLFVNGMPGWCVAIACVHQNATVTGVIVDPVAGECFAARRGRGATVNTRILRVSDAADLTSGSVAVGYSPRVSPAGTLRLLERLLHARGMYYRSGSGALNLAYVAAGRLIGYVEPHMFAWDCLAALLMVQEAGGIVLEFDMPHMLKQGHRVVAGGRGIYPQLAAMAEAAYA